MNEELDIAAAEYALGTLPADERASIAERMKSDPALRDAVRQWQSRLSPLADAVAAETPRPEIWRGIERMTSGAGALRDEPASNVVVLRRRLAVWRSAAIVSGALAAGLAVVAVIDRMSVSPVLEGGRYVAVVDSGGHEPALIAEVDTATGVIRVRSLKAETPAGQSLELWHVPEGEAPRSLGILEASADGQTIENKLAGGPLGGIIAVSVEPAGGSPSGAPTGPVVYTGRLIPVE